MSLLWFLVVGLVAGWLAGVLVKGGGFGVIGAVRFPCRLDLGFETVHRNTVCTDVVLRNAFVLDESIGWPVWA